MTVTRMALASLPAAAREFAEAGAIYNASLHDPSMKVPGGGLLSTSAELVRFSLALLDGRLISTTTREAMWTDGKIRDGSATGYGLGWGVTPAKDGVRRLSHSGNQAGAAGVLHVLPEAGLSYAILTNLQDTQLGPMSRAIAGVLRTHLMAK